MVSETERKLARSDVRNARFAYKPQRSGALTKHSPETATVEEEVSRVRLKRTAAEAARRVNMAFSLLCRPKMTVDIQPSISCGCVL